MMEMNGGVAVQAPLTNGFHHNGHVETMAPSTKNIQSKHTKENQSSNPVENGSAHLNGPNQLLPATEYHTTSPENCVRLRVATSGPSSLPPMSIPGVLSRTVARYPDQPAYAFKASSGGWTKVSYKDYQTQIRICAKAFLKLGLERYHSVCILGFNSPEWFISDIAAIHAGGLATGIYTTNSPEACWHVLESSRCNIVVVQDAKQMEKITAVWERLPELKVAVQWEGTPVNRDNVYSWEQLTEIGKKEPDTKLDNTLKQIAANECCTLVYTSGTVGAPKAVMLSHDNLYYETHCIIETIKFEIANERIVSYLPLSHVAAQILDIHMPVQAACTVYFADKDALKGSLVKTLQEAEPTKFLGVPRVWEKMHEKMTSIGAANGYVKQAIAGWAKRASLNHHMAKIEGKSNGSSYSYSLAQWLVLNRVKAALGLGKCNIFASSAAPLSADVKRYFMSLDMPIIEAFGMSEACGAHCFATPDNLNLETVGVVIEGVENKFHNADPVTGHGELCMRGRHVFMGYLNQPEKTAEAIDEEGWLHSGDIGHADDKGFMYITGRIKELIITAGGENVAPVLIEQNIKAELPCISHAVVVGDRRKFLSVLLTLKCEVDRETGAPLDKLSSDSLHWLQGINSSAQTVSEIVNNPHEDIMKAIHEGIVRANVNAISNAQKVQKFAILPADLTTHTGELGPTMKVKRNVVAEKYADKIESFYKG